MVYKSITHYDTLEIPRTATINEIQKAYRNLAKIWHPDQNPHDREFAEKKFQYITKAYEILSDSDKKKKYDDTLPLLEDNKNKSDSDSDDTNPIYVPQPPPNGNKNSQQYQDYVHDIHFGKDINAEIECTLEELYNGATKRVKIIKIIDVNNFKLTEEEVHIPAGTIKGTVIEIREKGHHTNDRLAVKTRYAGNLLVTVLEAEHLIFERIGTDLKMKLILKQNEALNGCTKKISTLDGKEHYVRIPRISRSDFIYILKVFDPNYLNIYK
jgi:DnaJ-class molecular chaperone